MCSIQLHPSRIPQANPDISTLWNVRREVLEELAREAGEGEQGEEVESKEGSKEKEMAESTEGKKAEVEKKLEVGSKVDVEALLQREVELTQACLTSHPKSYGAWHHRAWALGRMEAQDWARELALCHRSLHNSLLERASSTLSPPPPSSLILFSPLPLFFPF